MQTALASRKQTTRTFPLLAGVLLLLSASACSTRAYHGVSPPGNTDPSQSSSAARELQSPQNPLPVSNGILDGDYQSWFNAAKYLVEAKLDVDLSGVALRIVDSNNIQQHAQSGLLRALKNDIDDDIFARALVRNILTSQSAGSVLAIYSPEVKAVLLHSDNLNDYLQTVSAFTSDRAAMQALLLHELVHAADDKKHNVFDQTDASYQAVFTKSTILEGHAQWQARRLCEYAACVAAFEHLNHYMFSLNSADDPAVNYIQTRNFRNLEFIYREGERFVDHLMQQHNGATLLHQAFKSPPRDSLQIIDPASFPNPLREQRNSKISNIIKTSRKPWRTNERDLLTRNIVAAAAFTTQPETRDPIIEFYTERVVAAAKHEYYDRNSDVAIPVAITVMQTDNDTTARDTAAVIFNSTATTYQHLNGDMVQLSGWKQDGHQAVITDKLLGNVVIELHSAGGKMNNQLVQSEYPFEVVTASSGDFIVHIDGRYNGALELMQFAGRLLIELQRQSMQPL